jgi:hypothetical protein
MGLLRRSQGALMIVAGIAIGWLWLGNAGAALFGLWAWSWFPRWTSDPIAVHLADVRYARMGAARVIWMEGPMRLQQVFVDELGGADYATLRRELKAQLSS